MNGEADYVLALKGNQGTLHQAVIDYLDQQMERDFKGAGARKHRTEEKGHGRQESRLYLQMPIPPELDSAERWKGLKTIGLVLLTCHGNGKETTEIRYFISSLPVAVKLFAHAVRSHWSIENTCHWSLDFTYREDESRLRDERPRENFAWLNRFTLSLLKQHPGKMSLVGKRRACGWNDQFLFEVVYGKST